MRKLLGSVTIVLLAASLACNSRKGNQDRAGQSSKDEAVNGNTSNTPAGGRNTSTGNPAVDRTNTPTNARAAGSTGASPGSSDNGATPAVNDVTRPHPKNSSQEQAPSQQK